MALPDWTSMRGNSCCKVHPKPQLKSDDARRTQGACGLGLRFQCTSLHSGCMQS